jgi:serine/threonine-protein kinase RsbW
VEHVQQTFKLSVPSDTANLSMVRDFIERAARRSPIESAELSKLTLAVDEACANVIEHAHGNDAAKELTIRVSFDDTRVEVDVIDSGRSFDPTQHAPISLKDLASRRKDGGMGIRIMQMATDELSYSLDDDGHNRLRLVKHIRRNDER